MPTPDRLPHVLMLVHRFADNSPYSFYVHAQALALRALGVDVTVVAPVGTLPWQKIQRPAAHAIFAATPRFAVVDGIPVHYPRFPALGNAGEDLLGGRHEALFAWPTVRRLHAEKPFDLIHAHLLTLDGHAGLLLGKRLGIPVALTAHGIDVFRNYTRTPSRRNISILRDAGALMAVSEKLASYLRPYRPDIQIVPNGVDTSRVPPGSGAGSGRLLSAGTLKERKGMLVTLEAFRRIAEEFPAATLTVVGEGPERPALEAEIAKQRLNERVTLAGVMPHGDLLALMSTCDAFLMPSYDEGFGVVYIESMAAGCVAVGAENEGIADVISSGENGFLVPARDPQALAEITRRILHGGSDIEAVRARGTQAAKQLTWDYNARQTLTIYQSLL